MQANSIYVIVPFSRPNMLENVINNFTQQKFINKKLIIVENGSAVNYCKLQSFSPDILLVSGNHQSIAKNLALEEIRKRGGGYCTIFDDDDYYGPEYLNEIVENSSKAEMVGKTDCFIRLSDGNLNLCLGNLENTYTNGLNGQTISCWAEDAVEYDTSAVWCEDNIFIQEMMDKGGRAYSVSRWHFAIQRAEMNQHTWKATDDQVINMMFLSRNFDVEIRCYFKRDWSYNFINNLCEEPDYQCFVPCGNDQEQYNPAKYLLDNLSDDILDKYECERKQLLDKIESFQNK